MVVSTQAMNTRWRQLLCAERLGHRPPKTDTGRSPFLSDHDKIMFSGAFRRLAKKTQVHPFATNDLVHNRMTHSLEVACVGRSLAHRVGQRLQRLGYLPQTCQPSYLGDIVQASCLAHDIGNPPFGHTGESAIRGWFETSGSQVLCELNQQQQRDFLNFDGNAQGLRILINSEYHLNDGGMRLTYATLASFLKYPWLAHQARKNGKFGVQVAHHEQLHEIAQKTGMSPSDKGGYHRHPLVYLMEAADDFCYGVVDLEDGLLMGLVAWDDVFSLLSMVLSAKESNALHSQLKTIDDALKPALVRGQVIEAYINAGVEAFMTHHDAFVDGSVATDLVDLCSAPVAQSVHATKALAKERIFQHPQKLELEVGAFDIIAHLLDKLVPASLQWQQVDRWNALPKQSQMLLQLMGIRAEHRLASPYHALMSTVDFVSGMTDNHAVHLAKQLRGLSDYR